jgi:hypothetical protein
VEVVSEKPCQKADGSDVIIIVIGIGAFAFCRVPMDLVDPAASGSTD